VDPALRIHRNEDTLPEQQLSRFRHDVMVKEGLTPYRTEWIVYNRQWRLAGSIDCVMIDKSGEYHILDWKRSKVRDLGPEEKSYNKWGKGPCKSLEDTNFNHYCMQVNMYKAILESQYDLKIKSMRIVQFHPVALDNYKTHDVPDLQNIVTEVMRQREEEHARLGGA